NTPGRAVRKIDHVVGRAALAVVEAAVRHLDPRGARFDVVAAGTAFEAASGHLEAAIVADVERMGPVAVGMLAEAAEGRSVDRDAAGRIAGGENAALAIGEDRLRYVQIALFDADAGAVAILD